MIKVGASMSGGLSMTYLHFCDSSSVGTCSPQDAAASRLLEAARERGEDGVDGVGVSCIVDLDSSMHAKTIKNTVFYDVHP